MKSVYRRDMSGPELSVALPQNIRKTTYSDRWNLMDEWHWLQRRLRLVAACRNSPSAVDAKYRGSHTVSQGLPQELSNSYVLLSCRLTRH